MNRSKKVNKVSNIFKSQVILRKININYSLLQVLFWIDILIIAAFSSAFLLKKSISNYQIGLILATANILSVGLQSILSSYIDRRGDLAMRSTINFLLSLVLFSNLLMIFDITKWLLAVSYVICYASIYALLPLINASAMTVRKKGYQLNFPLSRAIGSIGYAGVSFVLGFLISRFGINILRHLITVSALLNFLIFYIFHKELDRLNRSSKLKEVELQRETKVIEAKNNSYLNFFRKYPGTLLLLISLSIVMLCHTLYANFTLQIVAAIGGNEKDLGVAGSIAACLELIPMLFLFNYMTKKFKLRNILQLSILFFILKATATFLSNKIFIFYLSQIFQIGAFGTLAIAIVYYLSNLVQEEDEAKSQSLFGIALCIGSILSSLIGGYILQNFPIYVLHLTCISTSIVGFVLFLISSRKLAVFEDRL